MSRKEPNISIPLDLTNPGQFLACCGLLELADRLWPGAEGWFEGDCFLIAAHPECALQSLLDKLAKCAVANTMTPEENARLDELAAMKKKQRQATPGLEDEKKALESLRREAPIVLNGPIVFRIDWFCDEVAGGARLKTWAGQQSVLDIAQAMQRGLASAISRPDSSLWDSVRGISLPFNFDSDLGGQGTALDIGFSFDPLASSEATRIEGTCRPALELLCFVGCQRFRPREIFFKNRFVLTAWRNPMPPSCASAAVCGAANVADEPRFEFKLLYRTKYLKSFLPSIPFQGELNE